LLVDPDIDPFDDYDRLLLYLWNGDGTFINLALVEGGFAEAIRVAPNDLYFDELLAAEDAATRGALGMWGSC
jgi:micrococcal nuclease